MTLLEVTVAMALFVTGVLATVTAMDSGTNLVAESQRRAQATQIASSAIEQLRSVPYAEVGHSASDPDAVGSFEGLPTVRVDSPFQPARSTVTEGSTTFVVTRHITWSSTVDIATQPRFKRLIVIVTWDQGRASTVRLDSAVADGSHDAVCAQPWTDVGGSIGGTINTYVAGTTPAASGATGLSVGAERGGAAVSVGDLLLVVEMSGVDAGTYEYAIAASGVSGGRLAVTGSGALGGLINSYGVNGLFQVVRVPTYGDVTVASTVTAAPWDGRTGGVVAFDSTGTVRSRAAIDATASLPSSYLTSSSDPDAAQWSASAALPSRGQALDGGGLIAVRAAVIIDATLTAAASKDGHGGVVMVHSTAKPTGKVVAQAGAPGGGPGGTVLSSVPLAAAEVDGGGGEGLVVTISGASLVGVESGIGCAAAVETSKTTSTPRLVNAKGGIGRYEVTVRNAAGRGLAESVVVADTLPNGVTYLATSAVRLDGDAARVSVADPAAGDRRPAWGTFMLPEDSAVTIAFSAAVGSTVPAGTLQNRATTSYASGGEPRVAAYLAEAQTGEDIFVSPFECREPWTDASEKVPSGVLNTYHPGAGSATVGSTRLAVGAAVGAKRPIAAGDLLLIIQMQDAFIDPTNGEQYGDGKGPLVAAGSTDIGNSGRYEYVVATSAVRGGTVDVSGSGPGGGTVHAYTAAAPGKHAGFKRFQVIRVPTFPSATVAGVVRPLPWDGAVGGVVAFDVAGTLSFEGGVVDASGAGFRGGAAVYRPESGNDIAVDEADGAGGVKGEGLSGSPRYLSVGDGTLVKTATDEVPGGSFGRGAPALAGGGGAVGSGAGGGANHGAGGIGASSGSTSGGGVGGAPIDGRLVLGGGGGAAASSMKQPGAFKEEPGSGGRGGGVVLVRALDVQGTGAMLANGLAGGASRSVGRSVIGGGGGGAGGSVVLSTTQSAPDSVAMLARGGDGGMAVGKSDVAGGGGGGGLVQADTGARADVAGGASGAAAGTPGVVAGLDASAIDGLALGVGCRPLLEVVQFATTPKIERVKGATAEWAVAVSNSGNRATLTDVVLDGLIPPGWSYVGTSSVDLAGGVTRSSKDLPAPGTSTPRWGSFVLPAGATVKIVFSAEPGASPAGTLDSSVRVSGVASGVRHVASTNGEVDSRDDVTLSEPRKAVAVEAT